MKHLQQALAHMHSSTFLQEVAWGTHNLKFDDGTQVEIPALQRKLLRERM